MSDYSELGSLIGKLKRAAIDVYMTSEANFYEVEGDRYRYRGSGRGMTQWCTRPGADGEGGGDVSMDGMPDFLVTISTTTSDRHSRTSAIRSTTFTRT